MVIGLAMAVGTAWPLAISRVVRVVGNWRLRLFILVHKAAHGLLHPSRLASDQVAC